ncbi:MAG: 30S ribosomal protein S11 [Patescibacteria group bacterium]
MAKAKVEVKKDNKKLPKTPSVPRRVSEGRLCVNATFNNTLVTITDSAGAPLLWTSCGRLGFKGTRKSTPFAATSVLEDAVQKAVDIGIKRLEVYIRGPGPGRDSALRVLRARREVELLSISDVTPIPHNGPRAPKRRRGK